MWDSPCGSRTNASNPITLISIRMQKILKAPTSITLIYTALIATIILFSGSRLNVRYVIYGFALGVIAISIYLSAKQLHWHTICGIIFFGIQIILGLTFLFRRLMPAYWNFLLGMFLSFLLFSAVVSWRKQKWIEWSDLYSCHPKQRQ